MKIISILMISVFLWADCISDLNATKHHYQRMIDEVVGSESKLLNELNLEREVHLAILKELNIEREAQLALLAKNKLSSEVIEKKLKKGCMIIIRQGNAQFRRGMSDADFAFIIEDNSTFHIDSACWNEDGKGTFYSRAKFVKQKKKLRPLYSFFGVKKR